jgi:transcriptional regulator with XRE-family HTH domain
MHSTVTEGAAKELGRSIRFIRQARSLTLRDVAKGAGLSAQYLGQIELAQRLGISEEAIQKLARPLGVPEAVMDDLLMRARIQSALETRGLGAEDVSFVWRGVEQRLAERGIDFKVDISKIVTEMLLEGAR